MKSGYPDESQTPDFPGPDFPAPDVPAGASAWALRLNAGDLTAPERHAFAQWLAGDAGRLGEVKQAQAVLRVAGALRGSETAHAHLNESLRALRGGARPMTASFPTRRTLLAGAASLAAGALVAGLFLSRRPSGLPVLDEDAQVATAVGDIEHFRLPDRSSLTVGARSAVQMAFTGARREIALQQGKAYFDVAPDPARPFVLSAGSHRVVSAATKLNVSYNQAKDQLEVAVIEGAVKVSADRGARAVAAEQLTTGAVTLFPSTRPGVARNLSAPQASAWRTGVLYFDDAELDDLVLDVNGYVPKPLVLAGADLSDLTLTAQLPAGDTQATLFVLREVLGLEARELPDRWEVSKA